MNTRGPHTRRFGQTEKYLRSGQKIFESLTRNIWIRDKIFDTVQTIYKMISIESWEMERMNYCRGTPVLVSAGWLHEAGAAENKDVIHGRQIICSVIHGAERGMDHLYQHCTGGLLTVGLFITGQFSYHSRVFCSTADVYLDSRLTIGPGTFPEEGNAVGLGKPVKTWRSGFSVHLNNQGALGHTSYRGSVRHRITSVTDIFCMFLLWRKWQTLGSETLQN